ncbi:MAG: cob(I)yrinic acid a,c-diamide adenosyltransferase [Dysgonomonas sp.]|jgi:ATP:cob(I)alamin adenosyltransferase|uniref:cob(I)yrinic acid a,c-diamide adenosyltransferase n=1 Tax=unclassified Dysgonomonas TaxID=2630389 RepID=UPI0025C48600|nr:MULTISPECIES: cob(I)yrinic acid a,c-diamide adenosyltransferase [unclassified Dysgonomonas]MDR1716382.1 cob(I)yrinic acid a,c-diamide adenosyltransferase [Prevotella sp.]MDR2002052.1 cob(I)yrinic acid a,c-diamide adenosyltransferase [Prevotella sp.]HMM01983.1 cob(I)yrinic acid a,c-diamide adenosyltransferase [Dysgonomonas sp.]
MKIYTRGGDKGKTGIFGGQRVDKDDVRIEANGTIDELNSVIGIVRANLPADHEWQPLLFKIQTEMMSVMSQVATPSAIRDTNTNTLDENLDKLCEEWMDRMTDEMGPSETFILPGGTIVSAHIQLARAVARRAERRLWTLNKQDEVPAVVMRFINRLSDLFFTMARYDMYKAGNIEERWKDFLYKRKKTPPPTSPKRGDI